MDKKYLQNDILAKPYNRSVWQGVLTSFFSAKTIYSPARPIALAANEITQDAFELGNFYTADERLVGIYEIVLKDDAKTKIEINRVGLRSLLSSIYKYDVDAALVVFTMGDKWRFSYISEITTAEGKKQTEPKRYTYLFGDGESCRTAAERFMKLQGKKFYLADLYEAFSVEKLNDEFFTTYKEFYEKFWRYLNDSQDYRAILIDKKEAEPVKQEKPIRDFAKKLLGRIVFLHFLQKKGWMGCPLLTTEEENDTIWKGGIPQFMQLLFNSCGNQQQFYSISLKTLFFETLNTKRTNNIFSVPLPHSESGSAVLTRVPYLNGGLFDRDVSADVNFDFPPEYFKSLFDFFDRYNFTIDENDPYDSEVGIDPEMLGHIFENLLEEYRDKGIVYTPREIVQYMCRESLLQYLRAYIPECTEDDSPATKALEQFVTASYIEDRDDRKNFIVQSAKRIESLLEKVKICDPAIGSGAFPMGMLQQIFKARMALDLTRDRAAVKKDIIQKNIYGVDIESGAVDIARLRFWLALVVDEEVPQPLPNLDYKIMQGNSLFESFEMVDLTFEPKRYEIKPVKEVDLWGKLVNPQISITEYLQAKAGTNEFDLTELEGKYFNSNNAQEKQEIKNKIDVFEKEFIEQQINKRQQELDILINVKKASVEKKRIKEFEQHIEEKAALAQVNILLHEMTRSNKPYFLWHLYFMDVFKEGGFDIVIGNPPYLRIQGIRKDDPKMAGRLIEKYKAATGSFDLYTLFVEMGLSILKPNGILNFIMPVKWTNAASGEGLRNVILKEKYISKIISFGAFQVFNVSTYTGLQWFKKNSSELLFKELDKDILSKTELAVFLSSLRLIDYNRVDVKSLSNKSWILTDTIKELLVRKILNQPLKLKNVFEKIFVGLQTSLDKVYVLKVLNEKSNSYKCFSNALKDEVEIEKGLVKPFLMGKDVKRYETPFVKNVVIFPYEINNKSAKLMSAEHLSKEFPLGWDYLLKTKTELENRENGKMKNHKFYAYVYPKNLADFHGKKILTPEIANKSEMTLDEHGIYYHTTKVYSFILKDEINESLKYFLGILNSKLLFFFLSATGYVLRGGYFTFKTDYLSPFPIKTISFSDEREDFITSRKEAKLNTAIWENKIDALVFNLYDLTEDEILQILNSVTDLSIKDKNQIQNEFWNIANNKFQLDT